MKLAALPAALGCDLAKVRKGHFPHFFNVEKNYNYVGPIPDLHYFGVDDMFPAEREALIQWHSEQRRLNIVWNFAKEMYSYAINDVVVLAQACCKYRELIQNIVPSIEVFHSCITLPQVSLTIFKTLFLEPNSIVLIDGDAQNPAR